MASTEDTFFNQAILQAFVFVLHHPEVDRQPQDFLEEAAKEAGIHQISKNTSLH